MKGLKKIALVSAIAAMSAGAQAELKALDDSAMGELTGQKGLTIDLETKWTIGEFAYVDGGAVVLKDLALGANSNASSYDDAFHTNSTLLDNIRLEIDVAGSNTAPGGDAYLAYGFSNVKDLAALHMVNGNSDADLIALSGGSLLAAALGNSNFSGISTNGTAGAVVDNEVAYGDGDLKIHFTFTDAWQKGGGFQAYSDGVGNDGAGNATGSLANVSYAAALDIATRAVDFQFDIGQIALADSTYGSSATSTRLGAETIQKTDHVNGTDTDAGGATTTTLISDLSFRGYLGPEDLHIENRGNGFDGSGALGAGTGDALSKIHMDRFFKVTDLSLYIDIAGVQLSGIKINNTRGDTTSLNTMVVGTDASGNSVFANTDSFGFAHSKRDIYAVKDAVLNAKTSLPGQQSGANQAGYVDGIAINTRFKGDIDIGHLSFGDTGTSIGEIYLTDVTSTTNWTISAH
jgi:hypothetical protein